MLSSEQITACNGCSACFHACPVHCIQMKENEEGFLYPHIDADQCIQCNRCSKVCPALRGLEETHTANHAYAAINRDDAVRARSSSGGVFSELAAEVIRRGGIVIGAAFDDNLAVEHRAIECQEEIPLLCGSKYVQSRIGDSFRVAKEQLDSNRLVLFTGTPCQIGGLKAYLGKDYENLVCQDIACHGVASPLVLRKYINFREKKDRAHARRMFFRHKNYGWKTYSLVLEYSNTKEYVGSNSLDLYLRMFINNYSLRESCYQCKFKGISRQADITLADYWGVWNIEEDMDDDMGTSLVITHSPKGEELWNSIAGKFKTKDTDLMKSVSYNSAITKPVPRPDGRDEFFQEIRHGFSKSLDRFQHIGFLRRARICATLKNMSKERK